MHRAATLLAAGVGVAIAGTPVAQAAPLCTKITPTTTQCERGAHTQISSGPNVFVNTGPFTETPWTPVPPVLGVGGWAVPWWLGP
ncbi:MAG: hypothetical protein JO044_06250 [Mycobacteriaceae bacterium]|nr:hypothetical protein [Mycobacteriaceae bacterium]